VLTMQLGPEDVLLNLSVDFRNSLDAGEVESCIAELTRRIEREFPAVRRIFIEAEAFSKPGESAAPRQA
jgi:divalent metal cation (Fe/Co/Zn/Cd) transporter